MTFHFLSTGYGFVDFESPQAAEVAVGALQAQGIQAQMAKVGYVGNLSCWGVAYPVCSSLKDSFWCHFVPSTLFCCLVCMKCFYVQTMRIRIYVLNKKGQL